MVEENAKERGHRLNKVMKEFNLGSETIISFLRGKGHAVSDNLATGKLTEEQYKLVFAEFADDKKLNKRAFYKELKNAKPITPPGVDAVIAAQPKKAKNAKHRNAGNVISIAEESKFGSAGKVVNSARSLNLANQQSNDVEQLVDLDLSLFEPNILIDARKMADFYVVYYSFENTIRKFISTTLTQKYGSSWWDSRVPEDVKKRAEETRNKEKDSPVKIRSDDPLNYTTFGDLTNILQFNWLDFSGLIVSKKAMERTLADFGALRNVIAHSCILSKTDIKRLEVAVETWFDKLKET